VTKLLKGWKDFVQHCFVRYKTP